jgi:type II secretory pathway pseudopilin PulG
MKTRNGFTLIETILYSAIIAVASIYIIGSILILTKIFGDIRLRSSINISARTAMERMIREIRSAESIDTASIFGSHPGYLKLNTLDNLGNPTSIEFFLGGTSLMVKEGTSQPESLTASNINVLNLVFRQISVATTTKAVKIELEISLEKFYDTAILRKSYK